MGVYWSQPKAAFFQYEGDLGPRLITYKWWQYDLSKFRLKPASIRLWGDPGVHRAAFTVDVHTCKTHRFLDVPAILQRGSSADNPIIVTGDKLPDSIPSLDELVSSTQLIDNWRTRGLINDRLQSLLDVPEAAEQAQRFERMWCGRKGEAIRALPLFLRPIVHEGRHGAVCFEEFGDCVKLIAGVLMVPGYTFSTFCNMDADTWQTPDIMGVLHTRGERPHSEHMMMEGSMVIQAQPTLDDEERMEDGLAQCISRCTNMRKARQAHSYVLAGGLTDNRVFRPVLVRTGRQPMLFTLSMSTHLIEAQYQQTAAQDSALSAFAAKDLPQRPVDTTSKAIKELAFMVFLSIDNANLAAAADREVACLKRGQRVSIRSANGQMMHVVVDSVLSQPGPAGCVYTVTQASGFSSAASSRLVMKVAPPPLVANQAVALGRLRTAWTQVERESRTRQMLDDDSWSGLPRTSCLGHLDLDQQQLSSASARHALHGAAVVVMEHFGQPLPARITQGYACLTRAEVNMLVRQLTVPLLKLQCHGFTHMDVSPRNITRLSATSFGLLDLGTACTEEDWQHEDWQPPFCLLFSCQELIEGEQPGPLADLQSLIFVAMTLGGVQLPWARAAADADRLSAHAKRYLFMHSPCDLPGWRELFSDELRAVLEEILVTALRSQSEQLKLLKSLTNQWCLPSSSSQRSTTPTLWQQLTQRWHA